MRNIILICLLISSSLLTEAYAKSFKGAEYRTIEAYTYGRFEVRMKPAHRSGVVSSFFTYHEISNSISEWNEIDIENIGRYDDQIQFNTITPNQTNHVRNQVTGFNPYEEFHTYAFEWTPFYVAWFIDGNEVYRQTDSHIGTLNRAQKIMMNIWPTEFENWTGKFLPESLPAFAYYDWVKYYEYKPGEGNYGSDNNFLLNWFDDFNSFDSSRWQKATHTFGGNNSDFIPDNVVFKDGNMILCLTDETNIGYTDNSVPFVEWASGMSSGDIKIKFSEELDSVSAVASSNYFLTSGTVTNAALSEDKTTVLLSVSGYDPMQTANVIIQNVQDIFGNKILPAGTSILPLNYLETPAKINIGGEAIFDYLADNEWSVDKSYGHISGASKIWNSVDIQGTSEDVIYQNDMEGLTKYMVRLPNGNYKITFLFAEKFWDTAGKRIFDVYTENKLVIDNLDIVDSIGFKTALSISVNVKVEDELLDIVFSPEKDIAIVSGIIIEPEPTSVGSRNVINSFNLCQNYPNPFNPTTQIKFTIPENPQEVHYQLRIYDSLGKQVDEIINDYKSPGSYVAVFNGSYLSSGIYFYSLEGNGKILTKKMVLLK